MARARGALAVQWNAPAQPKECNLGRISEVDLSEGPAPGSIATICRNKLDGTRAVRHPNGPGDLASPSESFIKVILEGRGMSEGMLWNNITQVRFLQGPTPRSFVGCARARVPCKNNLGFLLGCLPFE
ncbi:unnamed protein product [Danaus chrysippus]|uniref:(African queen) hypothetical protein n=1 Tax=Danaus chrysippus TaxID=151541 RepID=A0A8J2W5E9_9NEOP|nr:unnamed protein product [Danaus chrysippus]